MGDNDWLPLGYTPPKNSEPTTSKPTTNQVSSQQKYKMTSQAEQLAKSANISVDEAQSIIDNINNRQTYIGPSDNTPQILKDSNNLYWENYYLKQLDDENFNKTITALGEFANKFTPTQLGRTAYDTITEGTNSGTSSFLFGNTGLVSRDFYRQHPYLSTSINLAGDFALPYGVNKTISFSPYLYADNLGRKLYPKAINLAEKYRYGNLHMFSRTFPSSTVKFNEINYPEMAKDFEHLGTGVYHQAFTSKSDPSSVYKITRANFNKATLLDEIMSTNLEKRGTDLGVLPNEVVGAYEEYPGYYRLVTKQPKVKVGESIDTHIMDDIKNNALNNGYTEGAYQGFLKDGILFEDFGNGHNVGTYQGKSVIFDPLIHLPIGERFLEKYPYEWMKDNFTKLKYIILNDPSWPM